MSPPSQGVSGSLTASKTTIKPDGVGSTRITAIWSPRDTDVNLDIHEDDRDVLSRSSSCTPRRTRSIVDPVDEGTATLTVYGCVEGSGRVVLKEYPLSENKVIATITITVTIPPPTTPEGSLNADPSSISAPGSSLVTATSSPANLGVEIRIISGLQSGECQSGGEGASDRSTTREDATLTRTVYGCTEGTGKVELWTTADPPQKLDTLTIPVSGPPVPPPPTETSGSVSANRTAMDKGHSTTVTGTWTPSSREATLDVASDSTSILGAGGCPDGSGASDSDGEVSLQVHGCAVGSGTVELRTANGDLLASVTITVNPSTTTTPSGTVTANRNAIDRGHSTTVTGTWTPTNITATLDVASDSTSILGAGGCPDGSGASDSDGEVSLQVHGCAVGTGTVELRTANGDLLDTTTIRVNPAGTKPPNPTGSIRALPAKIALGATTTIEADWRGVPVEPEIVVVNTSVLSKRADCPDAPGAAGGRSRRSADAPLVSEVSIKLYSCSHGSSVVRLWDEANDKTLAEVTVTVLEIPSIEDHRDIAYRWLNVTWKDSGYDSYSVDWRKEGEGDADWVRLSSTPVVGGRVHITGNSADVRGLEYTSTRPREKVMDVELRVVGHVNNTSAASPVYDVAMAKPIVSGHLPDHTVKYSLLMLHDTPLENMVKAASTAASEWAAEHAYIWMCAADTDCDENEDGRVITLKVGTGCGGAVACVTRAPGTPGVEISVARHRDMIFLSATAADALGYVWTDDEDLHGEEDVNGNTLLFLKAILRHEFGHTYGLPDMVAGTHDGIMDASNILDKDAETAILTITDADYAVLERVYRGHTPTEGW